MHRGRKKGDTYVFADLQAKNSWKAKRIFAPWRSKATAMCIWIEIKDEIAELVPFASQNQLFMKPWEVSTEQNVVFLGEKQLLHHAQAFNLHLTRKVESFSCSNVNICSEYNTQLFKPETNQTDELNIFVRRTHMVHKGSEAWTCVWRQKHVCKVFGFYFELIPQSTVLLSKWTTTLCGIWWACS